MSDITITEKNISRFNKRIKNSIKKHLGQDISLAQANLIIAEMVGTNGIHHLKEILKESQEKNDKLKKHHKMKMDLMEMIPNTENLQVITLEDGIEKRYVKYAMVKNDFIERRGLPYYINDPSYSVVLLQGEPATFFNDFQTAKQEILKPENADKMLLQYAIPAFSHMLYHFPICNYYHCFEDDGSLTCYFVDN